MKMEPHIQHLNGYQHMPRVQKHLPKLIFLHVQINTHFSIVGLRPLSELFHDWGFLPLPRKPTKRDLLKPSHIFVYNLYSPYVFFIKRRSPISIHLIHFHFISNSMYHFDCSECTVLPIPPQFDELYFLLQFSSRTNLKSSIFFTIFK